MTFILLNGGVIGAIACILALFLIDMDPRISFTILIIASFVTIKLSHSRYIDGRPMDSIFTALPVTADEAVPRVERMLEDAGLTFDRRDDIVEAFSEKYGWRGVFDIHGLTIRVLDDPPGSILYLGPRKKDTRESIARLRKLVEVTFTEMS